MKALAKQVEKQKRKMPFLRDVFDKDFIGEI